jgi:CHAD domain-containing protein
VKGKDLEIKEREDFREGIQRLLETLHDEAAKYIIARSRQHVSVHELRKNIKKIRGILRLIRHEIGNEKYHDLNDRYRELSRKIAVLRDDTSQIELLESMKKNVNDPGVRRAITRAVKQVEDKRKAEFSDFYEKNMHYSVCYDILSQKDEISKLEFTGDPDFFILKSLKRIHGRARSSWEISDFLKTDEIYHYWRKQVKYLMYQLMVLNIAWPDYFKVYIDELNKLSNLLGKLHDLNLFNEHINEEKMIVLKPRQKESMLKFIYRKRSTLKKKIDIVGETLFSESSEAFSMRIYDIWLASKDKVNGQE